MKKLEESEEKHCSHGNSMNEGPEASEGLVCVTCGVIQFALFHAGFSFLFSEESGPPEKVSRALLGAPTLGVELFHL